MSAVGSEWQVVTNGAPEDGFCFLRSHRVVNYLETFQTEVRHKAFAEVISQVRITLLSFRFDDINRSPYFRRPMPCC